ncbi:MULTISPECIES: MaoC family dehydratase [Zoogloea]|jgi:acyl dehydratase|uniref:MaoC family dehydratase n=1 Tax=Zoogloea dura TaxID=2728840 RepID=A0A848G1N7_9RHOO|nr:MaoC family dehydratase [Zoogloea dura]KAB2966131.1 MAG: MaoC family dehydratase [Zoogloea sp.]NML26097.1 MaoC family dehydratase [Zoogloea dura]
MTNRYLDDLIVGDRFISGGLTLTEAEIIDFAFRYDPQPFHLDVNAAAESPYGGLIASGFQSIALCFRLFIQSGIFKESSIGSPGLDEVRWLAPVRPGDTLHSEVEVLEVRPSTSKPDRGIARLRYAAVNQRGETVLSFIGNNMLKRRPG